MMSKKRKTLSHSEVWDDSALIDSWNTALSEYKHYHSLHARGEKVEDILRQADEADKEVTEQHMLANGDELEDGQLGSDSENTGAEELLGEKGDNYDDVEEFLDDQEHAARLADSIANIPIPSSSQSLQMPGIGLPDHLSAGMENEALKNLMMSWYYAGYYTGYYEGQRAGSQQHSSSNINPGKQSKSQSEGK